jgi:uncharacterized membrane protein YeiB
VDRPSGAAVTDRTASGRIVGLDLARFLAIAGMVITHAFTDLYSIPREAAASGEVPLAGEPAWAEALVLVLGGRSATLFYRLAGVGIVLLVKGDVRRATPRPAAVRRGGGRVAGVRGGGSSCRPIVGR